ncbi:MAG: hypothetical protein LUQ21_02350 [Methanothrix sp.]|nr:hypothetical protein [Methanothrix sp.]
MSSILETDEGDISRVLKEVGLEGEAEWGMSYLFTLAPPSLTRRNDDLACLTA